MKRKTLLFILMILLWLCCVSYAQEKAEIIVEDIQICTSVESRIPEGTGTTFSNDVEKLYCFTRIRSSRDEGSIIHVWTYNDREMARVELKTGAKTWRTWSTKSILSSWTGKWRVDVVSPEGDVLASKEFEIK